METLIYIVLAVTIFLLLLAVVWEMHRFSPFLPARVEQRVRIILLIILCDGQTLFNKAMEVLDRPDVCRSVAEQLRLHVRARSVRRMKLTVSRLEHRLIDCITAVPYELADERRRHMDGRVYERDPYLAGDLLLTPYDAQNIEDVRRYFTEKICALERLQETIDELVRVWARQKRDDHLRALNEAREALPKEPGNRAVRYAAGMIEQNRVELTDLVERLLHSEHPALEAGLVRVFENKLQRIAWDVEYARTKSYDAVRPAPDS